MDVEDISNLEAGDYQLEVTDANGCTETILVTVSDYVSLDENFASDIKIFPNPSTDFVQVSGLTSSVDYKIYNVLGAEFAQGVISDQEIIDVNDFSNGLYVLQLDDQRVFKFIKE